MRLICWHPLMTDHQAYTYIALVQKVERLRVHTWRNSDTIRAAQGWQRHSGPAGEEHAVPLDRWLSWSRTILREEHDAIHIFGSPFEDWRQIMVMMMACVMGRRVAIISEPYSISDVGYFTEKLHWKDRIKRYIRPWLYRAYGMVFVRQLDTVFAISPRACQQYAEIGVPQERIAPFGYFVPPPKAALDDHVTSASLRLAFIGSLIPRKGIDVAIQAVTMLRQSGRSVTLDLYGPGTPPIASGNDSVTYRGILPFGQIAATLGGYDALIVPSQFDGWGVVVNEAIQAGVPVAASDATGAGAFVAAHGCGALFQTGDVAALAALLGRWCDAPVLLSAARMAAVQAAPLLDPKVAAEYMVSVLDARGHGKPAPEAPWYARPMDMVA